MGQPGVISLGLNAVAVQVFSDVLGGFLQGHIDDARLVRTLAHPFDKTSAFVRSANRFHQQIEVRAIETGGHHIVGGDGEFRLHVGDDLGRRRCGQQQHLRDVELALIVGKLEVVRAKVMPPFGNAVRLVHHQQRDRYLLQKMPEALVLQALHGDHQNLQFAGFGPGHDVAGVIAALRRIDTARRDAVALQERQLILHQRQQG
ncbi:hypothetical protein D3C87_1423100 [compost metagenome]